MDTNLWNKIAAFDLDHPISEYGFSTRLANENYWTIDFTKTAILEYKKFMYLAATSDLMVSPSETVDIVWHEHLIFTQSYNDFCVILGKRIEHVPSTHNREDFEKFRLAKERTSKLYEENFGKQPDEIWNYQDMFEPLGLEKNSIKLRTFLLIGIFAFLILIVPSYFILIPLYIEIDNPNFVIGFIALITAAFALLELYNKWNLNAFMKCIAPSCFIFRLSPLELIFLSKRKMEDVIHGCVNRAVEEGKIYISSNHQLSAVDFSACENAIDYSIIETLKNLRKPSYAALLHQLRFKPVFGNISNSMNALSKYFLKSRLFGRLFSFNFIFLSVIFMFGFIRLITGIVSEKPVVIISLLLVVYLGLMGMYLYRLTLLLSNTIIPRFYKRNILPAFVETNNWAWDYFQSGNAVFAASFVPLMVYTERNSIGSNKGSGSAGCGSDGGSSCGSTCGSSCSSCGGCGD